MTPSNPLRLRCIRSTAGHGSLGRHEEHGAAMPRNPMRRRRECQATPLAKGDAIQQERGEIRGAPIRGQDGKAESGYLDG